MNAAEIKELVESFPAMAVRCRQLEDKLMRINGRDPLQEESILQRLEQVEKKMEFVNHIAFESDILTDREEAILNQRVDGMSCNKIGDFFNLSQQRITQILNNVYKKIESLQVAS